MAKSSSKPNILVIWGDDMGVRADSRGPGAGRNLSRRAVVRRVQAR